MGKMCLRSLVTGSVAILASISCAEGGKRPMGADCGSSGECQSGLCGGGVCLDPTADADLDGLNNQLESSLSTDPTRPDSDGDGKPDPAEVGADVGHPSDYDGDGKIDAIESAVGDSDGDCITDERDPQDDILESDLAVVADLQCCCEGRCSTLASPLIPTAQCAPEEAPSTSVVLTCWPGGSVAAGDGGVGAETFYPCDGTVVAPPTCDELADACNVGTWDVEASACVALPVADRTACDDLDACTAGDQCLSGACAGTPVDCSSLVDACNAATCTALDGQCHQEPVADRTTCDDLDACTADDQCTSGACGGTEVDCDDGRPCTVDSCDPIEGCQHDLTACECTQDSDCADADACTGIETCELATLLCVSGTPIDCSSFGDACNVGRCDVLDGQCHQEPVADGSACDDLDACSADDQCTSGACGGTEVGCDDGLACSVDSCDPIAGCQHDSTPCDALIVAVVSSTQIDLSWTYSGTGATGFEIQANAAAMGFTLVATLGPEARSFSHTGLTPSTEYAYRVTTMTASGPSGVLEGGPATTLPVHLLRGVTLPSALVTVKDSLGAERTALSNGGAVSQYAVDVSGLTPPFLLRVDGGAGRDLFSVATGPGVANINLFSDLVIGGWYKLKNRLVEDAFPLLDATTPVPTQLEIDLLTFILRDITLRTLILEGVDVTAFDVLTTLYPADGTGLDAVLGLTAITADRNTVTIGDNDAQRQCQQTTLVTWELATAKVTLDTTTACSGNRRSRSTFFGIVPTTQAMRDAVTGINADLAFMKDTVNAKGETLAVSDINPAPGAGFFHADFLHEGAGAEVIAAEIVTAFRGATIDAFSTNRIVAFDATSPLMTVEAFAVLTAGGGTAQERFELPFIDLGGNDWIFYGNRRFSNGNFDLEMRTEQGAFVHPTGLHVNVDVDAPVGQIAKVEVMESTGGVFPTFTTIPSAGYTRFDELMPNPPPAPPIQVESDAWYLGADVQNPADLPPGTVFSVRSTPTEAGVAAGRGVQIWQGSANAMTNEFVTITQPTGSTLADANLGGDLDVAWTTAPVSFAVIRIRLVAEFEDQGPSVQCFSERSGKVLGPTSTTGTIPMLSQCDGKAIARATVNLSVEGPHGERTHAIYTFGGSVR